MRKIVLLPFSLTILKIQWHACSNQNVELRPCFWFGTGGGGVVVDRGAWLERRTKSVLWHKIQNNMEEQVFQLTTQYKYAVLRVICFSFLSLILFAGINLVMMSVFPADWGFPIFILSSIPLIIFLNKYTRSIGKYEVTLKLGLETMGIAPLFEEYNEKIYLWTDLKEFRLITFPPSPGFYGVIYIKWQNGDSHHFSGQDLDDFYHYLQLNFPKKEWSFLGKPKKPSTR